jgi:hypothetical protein
MSNDNNLKKLIKNQRQDIRKSGNYNKMSFKDLKRLDTYIEGDIFNNDNCIRYTGELKKNTAIFSFKGKKVSLHRLLYHNFINPIIRSDILKFKCPNKGLCCSLDHIYLKGTIIEGESETE